jgi:hypothetical protein
MGIGNSLGYRIGSTAVSKACVGSKNKNVLSFRHDLHQTRCILLWYGSIDFVSLISLSHHNLIENIEWPLIIG